MEGLTLFSSSGEHDMKNGRGFDQGGTVICMNSIRYSVLVPA